MGSPEVTSTATVHILTAVALEVSPNSYCYSICRNWQAYLVPQCRPRRPALSMRTKAEIAALEEANGSPSGFDSAHSFLTEFQRAALDAALAAKQTAPGQSSPL